MSQIQLPDRLRKRDDLEGVVELIEDNIPGVKFVRNVDPNIGEIGDLLLPQHVIDNTRIFSDSVFSQIDQILNNEYKTIKIGVPLNGGLLAYYEQMKRFAYRTLKLHQTSPAFATKNGKGKDQYSFSRTGLQGGYNVFLLIDDIYDQGGSSANIISQVKPYDHVRVECLSTKVNRGHIQIAPTHVLPDEWMISSYCMDSGIGSPKLFTNKLLIEAAPKIEKLERQSALPLYQTSLEDINNWSEDELNLYIELLERSPFYSPHDNTYDHENFKFIVDLMHSFSNYVEKLKAAEALDAQIRSLIIDGYHLEEVPLRGYFEP